MTEIPEAVVEKAARSLASSLAGSTAWKFYTPDARQALQSSGLMTLIEALRPFASLAERLRPDDPGNDRPALATADDYRRAQAALAQFAPGEEG